MSVLIRLILGLIFAIGGLFSYYGNTSQNPVTGENQRVQLTPRQEIVLGLQSRQQMAARHGGLFPDQGLQTYMDEVGQRIVQRSNASKSPYTYEFHLLRDPKIVNAFALPGGQVFITAALLGQMKSEAQLAAVFGHEIGHVVGRHGAEHLAKQQLGSALVTAVGVAASGGQDGGQGAAAIAQATNQLVNLRYGRNDESESDRLGLKFMLDAGYDPRGILEVMQILAKSAGSGRQPEFLSSHPDPGNRLQALKAAIQKQFPQGLPRDLEDGRDRFAQAVLRR
ncbi:M48 family metalloprotease [Leptolyngbya boryana CZ1]|uniref:M48 family metalloprotease n=1 Tax=Leptolyngbya boryana CZ1 TaxID=3060204 RepID=A0AA97AMH3_LEPBY|nr:MULTISPECIES: M48 family metalloprotease [Leptolyngbya]MBN8559673.1 M48 family metalloprotease [Leptolyngbya sp. UWPOB_LEPTO1]WNZ44873.1 M48 family metalloprotease [Leptolyngbya boryana CZ1]